MLATVSWRKRTRKSVWRCTLIKTVHRRQMRHLKSWMRPWLVSPTLPRDDSIIKWAMQTLFSKENPKEEAEATITSIGATSDNSENKSLCHPRNSSTLCSLASSRGAEIWGRSSKDSRDSSAGRVKMMMTWACFSDKCCRCFSSSSSLYSQACSRAASFRMVRTTITACSALITTNSS